MQPSFAKILGLYIEKTDVRAQKINSWCLETFSMTIAIFEIKNKITWFWYLEEIFLIADIGISIALSISLLILRNAKINFVN